MFDHIVKVKVKDETYNDFILYMKERKKWRFLLF